MKDSLLEPRPTCLLVWTWKHCPSQERWWEQLGSLGQWFYDQCSDPRVCQGSFLGCWSTEWPGWWYFECKWLWQSTCGLHYHKGSGGRNVGLGQRSSGPGHSRSNCLWILGPCHSGHTDHKLNHKHDQREWDRWFVSFPKWSRISHLLVCHEAEFSIGDETAAN